MSSSAYAAFTTGFVLSLSLIMAIGPQNAHVMRMGLQRQHLWLTVAICIASDGVLIGLGVLGLASVGGLSELLQGVLIAAGALFLLAYGWQAFRRFLRPAQAGAENGDAKPGRMTRWQATLAALAFTWLNPHAWLDTAVLIGTASLAWGADGVVFGLGAFAGSTVWFSGFGLALSWLGGRLDSPIVWRALDGLVALMMWGTAIWLLASLF